MLPAPSTPNERASSNWPCPMPSEPKLSVLLANPIGPSAFSTLPFEKKNTPPATRKMMSATTPAMMPTSSPQLRPPFELLAAGVDGVVLNEDELNVVAVLTELIGTLGCPVCHDVPDRPGVRLTA